MSLFGPPRVSRLAAKRDVDGLIKALQYRRDAAIPVASAHALGELGDARAVEPLLAVVQDQQSPAAVAAAVEALGMIRDQRAVEALGKFGDPRSVEPLIGALHDSSEWVRGAAAEALGMIGDPRAVDPLIGALHDNSDWVIVRAAEALGGIGDLRSVDPLIDALAFRCPLTGYALRSGVADVLIHIGGPAVAPLIAALGRPSIDGRRAAADTLDSLGWKPDDGEAGAAYWAAKGQWARCAQLGAPAVTPLVRVLQDDDPGAVGALRAIGTTAVEPLIAALTAPAEKTRERAAAALCGIGDLRAVEPLIAALGVPGQHESARNAAAAALGELRDKRAVEPLITALQDTRLPRVHAAAAKALGTIGDPRAVEPLLAAHHDLGDTALGSLAQIGPPAVEPLAAALHDPQTATRLCAVLALRDIGGPRTVEPLTAAVHDKSTAVRKAAIRALGKTDDPRAVEPLVAALDDDNDNIRRIAEEILEASGAHTGSGAIRPKHYWRQGWPSLLPRLIYPCPSCGALVTTPLDSAFDDRLLHQACGKPMTVQPPVPCADPSCDGVYERCGGDIVGVAHENTGYPRPDDDHEANRDWEPFVTVYSCVQCRDVPDSSYPPHCGVVRCSKCGSR